MIPPFRRQFDSARDPNTAFNALGYAEGFWTPTVTFATPGDLSVVYSARNGRFTKIARLVVAQFDIITSTFTFTTASGNFQVTGLPFTSAATYRGSGNWSHLTGMTSFGAGYTYTAPRVEPSATLFTIIQMGTSPAGNAIAGSFTTGTNLILRGFVEYTI